MSIAELIGIAINRSGSSLNDLFFFSAAMPVLQRFNTSFTANLQSCRVSRIVQVNSGFVTFLAEISLIQ